MGSMLIFSIYGLYIYFFDCNAVYILSYIYGYLVKLELKRQ